MDPAQLSALNKAIKDQGLSVSLSGRALTVTWTKGSVELRLRAVESKPGVVTVPLVAGVVALELNTESPVVALRGPATTNQKPSWDVEDDHLRVDLVAVKERLRFPTGPGHVDLLVEGVQLYLRLYAGAGARAELWAATLPPAEGGPAKCALEFDLTTFDEVDRFLQRLPMKPTVAGGRFASVEFALDEPTRLLALALDGSLLPEFRPDRVLGGAVRVVEQELPELGGPILGDLGVILEKAMLGLKGDARVRWDEAGLTVEGLALALKIGDEPVELVGGRLRLDKHLCLRAEDSLLEFRLAGSVALPGKNVLTLVLHDEHLYRLELDGDGLRLVVRTGGDTVPAASIFVPALHPADVAKVKAHWAFDGGSVAARFVLDVRPMADDAAISVGPAGVVLRATARRRTVALPHLRSVATADGEMVVRGGVWSLAIRATAGLPWFRNARGEIEVRGGSGVADSLAFDARFEMALGDAWRDPSGVLTLRDPQAWVRLEWKDTWKVDGGLSGSLEFGHTALLGAASEWVGEIFSGLTVAFDRLALGQLASLVENGGAVALKLRRGFSCALWDVFRFDLEGLQLTADGLSLAGALGFRIGPVGLQGRLPELRLRLDPVSGAVSLAAKGGEFVIEASLDVPSGVRARMKIGRVDRDGISMLEGKGTLSVPALTDAEVFVAIGRFRRGTGWAPTIALYGQIDVMVQALPGLVIRKAGVGFGVNRTLAGFPELAGKTGGDALREHLARGVPLAPGDGAGWVLAPGNLLTLVARCTVSGTTAPEDQIDVWVGDMVLALDSKFRFVAAMNAWLFTSLKDAAGDESVRRHPFARAALVVDPGAPSLVAAGRTLKDGQSSLTRRSAALSTAVTALVSRCETQASLEIRPHLFDLQVGPSVYQESLGDLGTVQASSAMRVRVERGRGAVASLRTAWKARIGGGFSGRLGPVEFGVAAEAGFALALVFAGGLHDSRLVLYGRGSGRAWFKVSAWARVSIRIEAKFKLGPFKVRVRVSFSTKKYELQVGLEANVELEAALGWHGASARAVAKIKVRIAGIDVSETVRVTYREDKLKEDRVEVARLMG